MSAENALTGEPHLAVSYARPALSMPVICALALAVFHFGWLYFHFAPASMSPDANGYVVQARLIATEGRTSFTPESPAQFVGMHWLETEDGVFHSRYPAGLAVLFALAWKVGGFGAALLVNPVLASATVLLIFFLARRFVDEWLALLAAVVMALAPTANQHALAADAHTGTAFFLVGGILALLKFAEAPSLKRGLVAGLLLGVVPTIRYPEAIAGLAIGGWLLWRIRPVQRIWPAVVGAALPIGAQLIHNATAYGAFWRTGYALTNEQTGFGWDYFTSHALSYLQSLGGQGLGLFFAVGVAGLAMLAVDSRWRSEGVLFAGIVVPLVLLYMAYYFGGGGGNLRFLIPTYPFFALGGVWLLAALGRSPGARAAIVVVASLQLLMAGASSAQMLTQSRRTLTAAARARTVAEKELPAGSVLIVDRQLAESLDATGRWRLVEENLVGGLGPRPQRAGGIGPAAGGPPPGGPGELDPDQPSPQQVGKNRAQQERYRDLGPRERRALVWADLAAWAGGKPIYWYARSIDMVTGALPENADYENITEIDAPVMAGPGPGPGPMAPPMMGPPMGGKAGARRGGPGGFGRRGGLAVGRGPNGAATAPAKLRLVRIVFRPS